MQAHEKIQRATRSARRAGALALLALSPLLGSCASTGGGSDPEDIGAARASILQFPGADFILVNETYAADRAGQALQQGTKVAPDEAFVGVDQLFDELGFWDHARPGAPPDADGGRPTDGGQPVVLAVTYTDGVRSGWLPMRAGQPGEELEVAAELVSSFTALWNRIEDYHGVFNPQGNRVFQQPTFDR